MTTETHRPQLGLPLATLAALSLLAAPRVVLHDLGVATSGPLAALLALGPAAVWIAVTLAGEPRRPWQPLLVIGLCYGVLLAVGHNLLWHEAYEDGSPELGGNLDGALPAEAREPVLRAAVSLSSVFAGALTGLACGAVATLIRLVTARPRQ